MRYNEHKSPPMSKEREQWEQEHADTVRQSNCELAHTRHFGLSSVALGNTKGNTLFDNLPKLMRPEQVAAYFDVSIKTIYDWRHRGCLRGIPQNMFLSLNRRLFIRTDVFVDWIASQNPEVNLRE